MPTVRITNNAWAHVNLEVRTGNYADPEQNQVYTVTALALNDGINIDTDAADVNYRRDPDPDFPNGTWNEWTTVATLQPYQEVFLGVGILGPHDHHFTVFKERSHRPFIDRRHYPHLGRPTAAPHPFIAPAPPLPPNPTGFAAIPFELPAGANGTEVIALGVIWGGWWETCINVFRSDGSLLGTCNDNSNLHGVPANETGFFLPLPLPPPYPDAARIYTIECLFRRAEWNPALPWERAKGRRGGPGYNFAFWWPEHPEIPEPDDNTPDISNPPTWGASVRIG